MKFLIEIPKIRTKKQLEAFLVQLDHFQQLTKIKIEGITLIDKDYEIFRKSKKPLMA